MLYKRCDHKTARDFLADRPGTRKPWIYQIQKTSNPWPREW
jgi:hypothetical protein